MTPVRLVALAIGHARRRLILSFAAGLIAALAAGGVVYLIGDSVHRSNELLTTLNSPDVRSVTIRANSDQTDQDLLPARTVDHIATLPGVERAIALSRVASATTSAVNDPTVTVGYFTGTALTGDPPYQLTAGRQPLPGEAIVSTSAATRLRLDTPTASQINVDNTPIATVGTYTAPDLGQITELLNTSVFTPDTATPTGYFLTVIIVRQPSDVTAVVDATAQLLDEFGTDHYTVEYDDRAAAIEQLVSASGRSGARSTAIAILAISALVEAAIAFINAILQRREIARRRALGFTRTMVFSTLIIETGLTAAIGAAIGTTAATVALNLTTTTNNIGITQPLATATLITLIALAATIPAGALAAHQDPARILRVP